MDFSAGFPGSFHDALALRNSVIFQHAEKQEILTDPIIQIGRNRIGPYLVGDKEITSWKMRAYDFYLQVEFSDAYH